MALLKQTEAQQQEDPYSNGKWAYYVVFASFVIFDLVLLLTA